MAARLGKVGRMEEEEQGGPAFPLLARDRGGRKRLQVENIAKVVEAELGERGPGEGGLVVDFGCGSGNLCLPLAARNPSTTFLLTDR